MTLPDRVRVTLLDYSSKEARTLLHVRPGLSNEALADGLALLAACSEGGVLMARRELVVPGFEESEADTGPYATHRDIATLFYSSDNPRVETPVSIPMPKAGIFGGDTVLVNASSGAVALLHAWLLENSTDENGEDLTRLVKGYRWRFPSP